MIERIDFLEEKVDFLEEKVENLDTINAELIHEVEQLKVRIEI